MSFDGSNYPSDDGLELTTKGQIHTYSTENTGLNVGTDTHLLTADSSEATGMKWAAASSAGATVSTASRVQTATFITTSTSYVDVTDYTITEPTITNGKVFTQGNHILQSSTDNQSIHVALNYDGSIVLEGTMVESDSSLPLEFLGQAWTSDADGNVIKFQLKGEGGSNAQVRGGGTLESHVMCLGVG